jgi:putative acetyltransferase
MIVIRNADPFDPDVAAMIAELDAYQLSIYAEESNHLDPVDDLAKSNVYFVGAYKDDSLVGIGALKYLSHDCDYGEIKRVWVSHAARGHGVSKLIMQDLECDARSRGVAKLRLETGIHQPEALGLYEKLGYRRRKQFGDYPDDPVSVFMEKDLG